MRKVRIVAVWWDGCRAAAYRRAFRRYLRRPTRCRPPLARDFPALSWGVQREGRIIVRNFDQFSAGAFDGGADAIRIQKNFVRWEENAIRLEVHSRSASGEFVFTPKDQLHRVTGLIRFNGEEIAFDGEGSHDHDFGVITSQPARVETPFPFDR
jgi:hypothetical protein